MPTYLIVGTYLAGVLKQEIITNTVPKVFDAYDDSTAIFAAFRDQLAAYTRQEHPFNRNTNLMPREYWSKLSDHKEAAVLAVRPLDLTPYLYLFYFHRFLA